VAADPQLKPLLDKFDTNVAAFKANPPDTTAAPERMEAGGREGQAAGKTAPRDRAAEPGARPAQTPR